MGTVVACPAHIPCKGSSHILALGARRPNELSFFDGAPDCKEGAFVHNGGAYAFSSDGSLLAIASADKVTVFNAVDDTLVTELEVPGASFLHFSPRNTFLATWSRPDAIPDKGRNLLLWSLKSKQQVLTLSQRTMHKSQWPAIQFNSDESLAANMVSNLVNVHSVSNGTLTISKKLPLPNVNGFKLSPSPLEGGPGEPMVAAFVPEKKGAPARASLFSVASLPDAGADKKEHPTAVVGKSFFNATEMSFFWSTTGSAVVMIASADVDNTNQSYYGRQTVHMMQADGSDEGAVPLGKEGPVYDVAWSPSGEHFVVVHGFMPAKAILFNARCKALFDFGAMPINTVRWNPYSKWICLAGFGNLPGDVFVYDRKADGKCKTIGQMRAPNSTDVMWAPDGRHLLTITVSPRLRVDNGFRVWSYKGEMLHHEAFAEMLDASWKPVPAGTIPERPFTPPQAAAKDKAAGGGGGPAAKAGAPAGGAGAVGYVPPHLRKQGVQPQAQKKGGFSLAYDEDDIGGKVAAAGARARASGVGGVVPGFEPVATSKSAAKNAKRRAKKKAAAEGGQ
ncbi:unnamed protein product [Pedinophyceae sp. YPF-701]|nr:unnamed protein product [Pedinophyceae sp. YPF-701]